MIRRHLMGPDPRFPWKYRRLCVFAILLLCGFEVVYLTLFGADTRLHETLAQGALALAGAVIGSYIFGAAYHDKNAMQAGPAVVEEKE